MAMDVSYVNTYGYGIDTANVNNTLKLITNNAAQKTANTPEAIVEQNVASTNSALLFEYTQNIAKSNMAQQLVLDNNLKETLKFLNSEAAKKFMTYSKKKHEEAVSKVLTENDINDFKSNEESKEEDDIDNLELFDIKIDMSKNIFAA